jgi:pimeloyl-ACP methyl ester carboxylesterase
MTVADCPIRVMRGGSGPTMLYLHGANSVPGWAPFLQALSNDFEVIVPEHPGFGATEDPPWLDNIHDEAYFYLSFLEQLDLTDVHLVGMSLGGWIAAEVAVRSTGRLASLTLCGASGIHVKGVPKGDMFIWSPEEMARNMVHDQSLAEKMLAMEKTPEEEHVQLRNWRTVALLAWQPRLYDPHLYKWLPRIDVPTHIIWGEHDKLLPSDYAKAWQDLISGSQVTILKDCGHLMHIEKPDAFAAAIAKGATA